MSWGYLSKTPMIQLNRMKMPLTIQIDGELPQLPGEWEEVGPLFNHVATAVDDFSALAAPVLAIEPLTNPADVDAFTDMAVDARIPQFARAQE